MYMDDLLISHVRPVYPGGQEQRKYPVASSEVHVPPFWHGLGTHASPNLLIITRSSFEDSNTYISDK